ncbi:MAG: hypothetical protein DMD79_11835 [Candidatus Rokuibacteriota bacterium]|nr:MAG: hypothetical protein DMD79_11835 [Candidatus Rokubacteria bacterium]
MTTPEATAGLLAQLDQTWSDLRETVSTRSERDLTEARDSAGWSAKDHLMHVAAWGHAFLASLDGRPRTPTRSTPPSSPDTATGHRATSSTRSGPPTRRCEPAWRHSGTPAPWRRSRGIPSSTMPSIWAGSASS